MKNNRFTFVVRYIDTKDVLGAFPFRDNAQAFRHFMLTERNPDLQLEVAAIENVTGVAWVWNDTDNYFDGMRA